MRTLTVFNNISLDGFFTDAHCDMSWAHQTDRDWAKFSSENANAGGALVFGRITYDMMASSRLSSRRSRRAKGLTW